MMFFSGLGFLPVMATTQSQPVVVKALEEEIENLPPETNIDDLTEEEVKSKLEEKLSQWFDANTIANIITWLSTSGVLTFALAMLNKIRRYKDYNTGDLVKKFEGQIKEMVEKQFKELGKEQVDKIVSAINDLEKAEETIMKVLVLMQDNTAKGKVALIEYLGTKTENAEVKGAIAEVETGLIEKEQAKEKVLEQVNKEYTDLF